MADAFAALWNSSVPSKPDSMNQTLGSATSAQTTTRKPQPDVFSLLATSSAPNSRPLTPSSTAQKTTVKPAFVASEDAFSGLMTNSLGGTSRNGANLTIAERAALAEKEQREQIQKRQQSVKAQLSAWDGLDMLVKPTSPLNDLQDDWGFDSVKPSKPSSVGEPILKQQSQEDDWGLSEFSAEPVVSTAPQVILDLDDLSSLAVSDSRPPPRTRDPLSPFNSPAEFGSGAPGDDNENQGDDDILGLLSKPVDSIRTRPSSVNHSNRPTPPPRPSNSSSRPVSPPPHILGQIVEMGFSIEQARVALASTSTGLDVQTAIDTLLSNVTGDDSAPNETPQPDERQEHTRRRPPRVNPTSTSAPVRELLNRETPSPSGSHQERAEKLLTQASEIGLSVISRANAFWNQSKEKVQKAYEEKAKAAPPSDSTQPTRPRWMRESSLRENDDTGEPWENTDSSFSDEVLQPKPRKPVDRGKRNPQSLLQTPDGYSDELTASVPPYRRGRPPIKPTESHLSSSPEHSTRVATPIQLVQRQTVSASRPMIESSAKHKATGGDKFKLGQYSEAEAAYAAAISALPTSHLLLIPLYNNRALTRIKTGDCTGAIEDCNVVITLIGPTYHPNNEAKVTGEEEGAGVDLGHGLLKAWKHRAEAYEGKEKWVLAQSDWESIVSVEWAGSNLRSEAIRGAGRCRRSITASGGGPDVLITKPPARPPAARPPIRKGPTPPSEALSKLREVNNAAEEEEQARHELKDTVDSRLVAWKGGKEANIRALIASLDLVLWPELGWQKVGMAELVTPSQVKIRYTKAIAKLHPDKLNSNNTTLEQKMIANGVFGTLNEAWNAFRQ